MKICTKCLIEKELIEFHRNNSAKSGYRCWCKVCVKIDIKSKNRDKNYHIKNKEKIKIKDSIRYYRDRDKKLKQKKEYYIKNKDKINEYKAVYRINNKEKIKAASKEYLKKNRVARNEYSSEYCKMKRRTDIKFNLDCRMGTSMGNSLKGRKNGRVWEGLIGYSVEELELHLKSRFAENMTWEEFLMGNIVIDHFLSRNLFDYKYPEDKQFQF